MRKRPEYCPDCGGKLELAEIGDKTRLFCPYCSKTIYENPLPATCVVATNGRGEVLITKRAVEPAIGEWSLPGGFVEIDESPQEGALRELREETGLSGEIIAHLGAEGQRSETYINVMIAGFLVRAEGEPSPGDDVSEALWVRPRSAPKLVFSSHRRIFDRAIEMLGRIEKL